MRSTLTFLVAGLSLSCFGGHCLVDAQFTSCSSTWSNIYDWSVVDAVTGSCIYGQKAEGFPAGTPCMIKMDQEPYTCQCVTQAEANGGDAEFARMEKKTQSKKRLRRAGWALFIINLLLVCCVANSGGEGGKEEGGGGISLFCLLFIIFVSVGYTNRDLYNPDLTPYYVGCGSQVQSVGAYSSLSGSSWSPSVAPPPPSPSPPSPAASATTCGGCLEGTAGECKQSSGGNVCVPFADGGMVCPDSFAPCSEVQDLDAEAQELEGSGYDDVADGSQNNNNNIINSNNNSNSNSSSLGVPPTDTKKGLSGGAIAGIVIGSIVTLSLLKYFCAARESKGQSRPYQNPASSEFGQFANPLAMPGTSEI